MREKGQQSAKILTYLVTYRGKKKRQIWFLLYVGRCKGKTDICQFFFFFFFNEPFPKKSAGSLHCSKCCSKGNQPLQFAERGTTTANNYTYTGSQDSLLLKWAQTTAVIPEGLFKEALLQEILPQML